MAELAEIWSALAAEGLIRDIPQRLGGGNADRNPTISREAWVATSRDGTRLKLTTGCMVRDYADRLAGLHAAAPAITPGLAFFREVLGTQVCGEIFFDGTPLDEISARGEWTRSHPLAVRDCWERLTSTAVASDDERRQREWDRVAERIVALPCWDEASRVFLIRSVLPPLFAKLVQHPPIAQWVHGDFTSRNMIVTASGEVRLIDPEFAEETHFPEADLARFQLFSAPPGSSNAASAMPAATDEAILLCWLVQVEREVRHNTAAYVRRWLPHRRAQILDFAQRVAGGGLPRCPWHSLAQGFGSKQGTIVEGRVEEARWLVESRHAVRVAGWCFAPGHAAAARRAQALVNGTVIAQSELRPRPDVQTHFGQVEALDSGFELLIDAMQPEDVLDLALEFADGNRVPFWRIPGAQLPGRGPLLGNYGVWAAVLDPDPPRQIADADRSTFSVLLPVYNTPLPVLRACVDSVRRQYYQRWELYIVDDASPDRGVTSLLQEMAAGEPRIRWLRRSTNGGIARATNDALAAATGDFITLLDHDDVLRPHALAELAEKLAADPGLDAVYSDEDKLNERGERVLPMFKPDFSPEFLRGVMYVGHVLCVRRQVAVQLGGFDPAYDGVQDFEFVLRLSERTSRIGHVPRVLYHWRQSTSSSALVGNVKGNMDAKQLAAVQAHLARCNDPRHAQAHGGHRVRLTAGEMPAIPMRVVTRRTAIDPVAALREARDGATRVVVVTTEELRAPDSATLRELAALADRPDSGCVAPVLVSPHGQILESGRAIADGYLVSVMAGYDADGDGYNGTLSCNREVSAVSPECFAVRAALLTDTALQGTWSDFLRVLSRQGVHHRVCASARVTSHAIGSQPLPAAATSKEGDAFDPFFNPHFQSSPADYRLARRPKHLAAAAEPFRWHLEGDWREHAQLGWFEMRGWCFHLDGDAVTVNVRGGDNHWTAPAVGIRSDVAQAYPGFTRGECGFCIRGGMRPGRYAVAVTATTAGGESQTLFEDQITIPRTAPLRRVFTHAPRSLLAFQMMSAPSHEPIPITPERFPHLQSGAEPTLLIVTPSYQHGRFVEQTVKSVVQQRARLRYVVQDGGSTDGTVDILRRYEPQLVEWTSGPDGGQARAIAAGFQKNRGTPDDVMAWINSDDFYMPGALTYVSEFFGRHPDVDVIYGHRVVIDEESREIGRWFLPPHSSDAIRLNDFVPQETLFWRQRVWDAVGGVDPTLTFAMDWDLMLKFQAVGARIVRVPYFLGCFRVHAAQKTSAQIATLGQKEIDALRQRTFGRAVAPEEIGESKLISGYLRHSAKLELLWRTLGVRGA